MKEEVDAQCVQFAEEGMSQTGSQSGGAHVACAAGSSLGLQVGGHELRGRSNFLRSPAIVATVGIYALLGHFFDHPVIEELVAGGQHQRC
jgi:hypothetical protein